MGGVCHSGLSGINLQEGFPTRFACGNDNSNNFQPITERLQKMFKRREGMRYRSCKKYQEKKREISGKKVVGIDPASEKHEAVVVKLASNINRQA